MADYKYAYNGPEEGTAKAVLKGAAISTKTAIEMSKHLKGKTTDAARAFLERLLKHEEALPHTRFTDGVGHKKGRMAAGRYPEKAAKAFLQLISVAEANASQASLGSELKIVHLLAHQASRQYHYGRMRRRRVKATHVEIVVRETEAKKKTPAAAKKPVHQPSKQAPAEQPVEKKEPKTVATHQSSRPAAGQEARKEQEPGKPVTKAAATKPVVQPSQPQKETAQQ